MAQSVSNAGSFIINSGEYVTIGKVFKAFFFTPMLATTIAGGFKNESLLLLLRTMILLEHLRAHLMMEFNPNEQNKAHKRTESTIITFTSKLPSPRNKDSEDDVLLFECDGGGLFVEF